jgi:hypothetical protein
MYKNGSVEELPVETVSMNGSYSYKILSIQISTIYIYDSL